MISVKEARDRLICGQYVFADREDNNKTERIWRIKKKRTGQVLAQSLYKMGWFPVVENSLTGGC